MNLSVGIGELIVAKAPAILETRGLGSCVGVALYDEKNKIGALAHIMLPFSSSSDYVEQDSKTRFRYVSIALPYMLEKMIFMGSDKLSIIAKIVGGASMFRRPSKTLNIGEKNISAVKHFMDKNFIKIKSEEIGGNVGRSMFFNLDDGKVTIKISGKSRNGIEL